MSRAAVFAEFRQPDGRRTVEVDLAALCGLQDQDGGKRFGHRGDVKRGRFGVRARFDRIGISIGKRRSPDTRRLRTWPNPRTVRSLPWPPRKRVSGSGHAPGAASALAAAAERPVTASAVRIVRCMACPLEYILGPRCPSHRKRMRPVRETSERRAPLRADTGGVSRFEIADF